MTRDHIRILESECKNGRFRKIKRNRQDRKRKNDWLEWTRETISTTRLNSNGQNKINLTNTGLSDNCKSLLAKVLVLSSYLMTSIGKLFFFLY